jgi:hypothetical protein
LGEKERDSKKCNPRFRSSSISDSNKKYTIKELHDLIIKQTKGFPQKPLPLSAYMSKRPKFK